MTKQETHRPRLTTKDSSALTWTARDNFVATTFILSSSRLVKRSSLTTYIQREGWTVKWKQKPLYLEIQLTQKRQERS